MPSPTGTCGAGGAVAGEIPWSVNPVVVNPVVVNREKGAHDAPAADRGFEH
ncbi:hypothetical protein LAUMK13_00920 [Mycobacterium innocens]|uniref:Uncharacterized protein n=1 Tax=Mycobacterium innocens TaxID=2341083 RepID=A0A498PUR6_9MYCO|nr:MULTISPECIES: hypothetical protein [Mycobacterium]VBA35873.1 hypothetical protein LAUMK13_00920 [Mycobacterium innocens]